MTGTGVGWRIRWQHTHDAAPGGITVEAGAVAVLAGDPTLVVATEQWHSRAMGLLKCDNTHWYRLADGSPAPAGLTHKHPFATPRIDTHDGMIAVNTSRGIITAGAITTGDSFDTLGPDWHALDLVTGRVDDLAVVVAAWDVPLDETGLHLRVYDLTTGEPVGRPRPLPWAGDSWFSPHRWRLGRWAGRAVAAVADDSLLYVYPAADDGTEAIIVLEDVGADDWPELLTVDDRAGPSMALVSQHNGVHCYSPDRAEPCRPPLTAFPGRLIGARLGTWRHRPVAAVLTSVGISLYDLNDAAWTRHVDLDRPVHDVAFAPAGELALITSTGLVVVDLLD